MSCLCFFLLNIVFSKWNWIQINVFHSVTEGGEATSAKEASAEEWAEGEEEGCMAMVAVVASMATTTMDLTMEEVVLEDEVVMMIGARGLERIWMDLPAGWGRWTPGWLVKKAFFPLLCRHPWKVFVVNFFYHQPRSPDGSENGMRRDGLGGAKSITDLAKRVDKSWEGGLILKNSLFPTKLLLTEGEMEVSAVCNGCRKLLKKYLSVSAGGGTADAGRAGQAVPEDHPEVAAGPGQAGRREQEDQQLYQPCNFPGPGLQQRPSANHRWGWGPESPSQVRISMTRIFTTFSNLRFDQNMIFHGFHNLMLSGILWATWNKRRRLEWLVCRTGENWYNILYILSLLNLDMLFNLLYNFPLDFNHFHSGRLNRAGCCMLSPHVHSVWICSGGLCLNTSMTTMTYSCPGLLEISLMREAKTTTLLLLLWGEGRFSTNIINLFSSVHPTHAFVANFEYSVFTFVNRG